MCRSCSPRFVQYSVSSLCSAGGWLNATRQKIFEAGGSKDIREFWVLKRCHYYCCDSGRRASALSRASSRPGESRPAVVKACWPAREVQELYIVKIRISMKRKTSVPALTPAQTSAGGRFISMSDLMCWPLSRDAGLEPYLSRCLLVGSFEGGQRVVPESKTSTNPRLSTTH
jgi:hypothetical protein